MADSPSDSDGETGDAPGAGPGRQSAARTPRWVNVFGVIALALILLFAVWLLASGGHGPGRHIPSGDAGGHAPLAIGDAGTDGVPWPGGSS